MAKVQIFNKGKRTWPITVVTEEGESKKVSVGPEGSISLEKEQAEKLVNGYPREFIYLKDKPDSENVKALRAKVKALTAENTSLKEKLAALEEGSQEEEDDEEGKDKGNGKSGLAGILGGKKA